MADISDVEQTLVNIIAGLVYPNGTGQPSAIGSAVVIHRGWPVPADLDADLAAGICHISVWPRGGTERNTTPYGDDWVDVDHKTKTLTASASNNQVTLGGTNDQTFAQYVTIQIGPRYVVSYQPTAGQTLAQIATAIAAQISTELCPASAVGAVITVSTGGFIRALVGTTGDQLSEVRRQVTQMQITYWCPTFAKRDALGKLLEPQLADMPFFTLPDQAACRLRYMMTIMNDNSEKVGLYRRDCIYTTEYPTTLSDTAFEVTSVTLNEDVLNTANGNTVAGSATFSIPLPPEPAPSVNAPYEPLTPS